MKRASASASLALAILLSAITAARADDSMAPVVDSIQPPAPVAQHNDDLAPIMAGDATRGARDIASEASSESIRSVSFLDDTSEVFTEPCMAPPVCTASVFGGASYLHLTPTIRGLDYAVTEDGSSLTVGRGDLRALEHESSPGVRTFLGYQTAAGWSLAVRYTTIDFEGADHVDRPTGNGQLFSTRTHPDGNEEADTADATGSLDYEVFDLELSNRIMQTRFIDLSVFGGVRWAQVELSNVFDYDGRDFVTGQLRDSMKTQGVGLQVGSEGRWKVAGGFSLIGRASAGVMRGRFQTHRIETNLNQAVVLVDATDDYNQAVPNVELAGGVGWNHGPFSIQCAYELIDWIHAYDRAMFVDDIHEASFGPFSEDILLDGFSITAMYRR